MPIRPAGYIIAKQMQLTNSNRVWLTIDQAALRGNFGKITGRVAPASVMAVLKANAYGLGIAPIARTLADAGAYGFGVAEINEALALAPLGLPVHILGGILPDEIAPAVAAGVILPVTDLATARVIGRTARASGKTARGHFLVDTGMGRLGMLPAQAERTIAAARGIEGLATDGIYTHFPVAYRAGTEYTRQQIGIFVSLLSRLAAKGIHFAWRHVANSDAINNFPETFAEPFNLVRSGINLHGSFDPEGRRSLQLDNVLTLGTRLVASRRLPAGQPLGYGCTYRLPRSMPVGTIAAGYADGLPMALSNRGYVLIRGLPCPILGRISMDYTVVSLEAVPDAQPGEEAICLGGSGPTAISVEDWATIKGTHPYDIICSFGNRVARRYFDRSRQT